MEISFCNSNDKNYQKLLNGLLKPIFCDFQFWFDLNLWDDSYESYSIVQNGEMISNICVFKSDILFGGKKYQALSLGAVATKENHRGNGYSRLLMEHVLNKYRDKPVYLFANDTVTDFYPRFGFKRVYEKLPASNYKIDNIINAQKMNYGDPMILEYVYKKVNYSQKFDFLNTASVNMFNIYWLNEHIYNIPELDTIVIAQQEQTSLNIIGVFSLKDICFKDLACCLPFRNIEKLEFGFMPCWDDLEYEMTEYETEPLFVRGLQCDLGDFKIPELSIT